LFSDLPYIKPTSWYINVVGRPLSKTVTKSARKELLEAAFNLIRSKGYSATSVDDLCKIAGVSKGTFFHYFESKEKLAVEAAKHWSLVTGEYFKTAPYHHLKNPLDRLLGYISFRKQILTGPTSEFTCLVGTMIQEIYNSHPAIREACRDCIYDHAENLVKDIAELKAQCAPNAKWSAHSLALHIQAVLQGGFILAKSGEGAKVAVETINHLSNYIEILFNENQAH